MRNVSQQLRELIENLREDDADIINNRFQPVEEFPLVRERFQFVQELLNELVYDLKRTVNKSSVQYAHTVSDYLELLDGFAEELEELEEDNNLRHGGAA